MYSEFLKKERERQNKTNDNFCLLQEYSTWLSNQLESSGLDTNTISWLKNAASANFYSRKLKESDND